MSKQADLTRWNRAGLNQFRYINGNAVTYLEMLRKELKAAFPQWERLQAAEEAFPQVYDRYHLERYYLEREKRLLEQYAEHSQTWDWGWEIARAFARACHILTEYINAYANEGYIGTATQWENVRKLVEMLDYHPAPPASAAAWIYLLIAAGRREQLKKGVPFNYTPGDGKPPVVFETLENLEADAALNALRSAGWNISTDTFGQAPVPPDTPAPSKPIEQLTVLAVESVGDTYKQRLIARGVVNLKNAAEMLPAVLAVSIPDTWLWEFKTKAWLIVDSSFDVELFAALKDYTLDRAAALTIGDVIDKCGVSQKMALQFTVWLRRVQIAMDEVYFRQTYISAFFKTAAAAVKSAALPVSDLPQIAFLKADLQILAAAGIASLADLAAMDPEKATVAISQSRLWSLKKAALLIYKIRQLPVDYSRLSADYLITLASANIAQLSKNTGIPGAQLTLLVRELKLLQVILGDTVFRSLQMNNLISSAAGVRSATPDFPWIGGKKAKLSAGQTALVLNKKSGAACVVLIANFDKDSGIITLEDTGSAVDWYSWQKGFTVLLTEPDKIYPLKNYPHGTVACSKAHGLVPGDVLVRKGGSLRFDLVTACDADTFRLASEDVPLPGTDLYKAGKIIRPAGGSFLFSTTSYQGALVGENFTPLISSDYTAEPAGQTIVYRITNAAIKTLYFLPKNAVAFGKAALLQADGYVIDGSPGSLVSGQWLTGETESGTYLPLQIQSIREQEDSFTLTFTAPPAPAVDVKRLYGPYKTTIYPKDYDRNQEVLTGNQLTLETAPPASLKQAKWILLEQENADIYKLCQVSKIEPGSQAITISENLTAIMGFTKGNTIIRGNLVKAGHGKSKPEKILGSGDAGLSSQSFLFEESEVAFTADPLFPSGVKADLELKVADRIWTQIPTLKYAAPSDPVYIVQMTEAGYLKITFGDGIRGRRLPSGTNNIRLKFRKGSGLAGNIKAGALSTENHPHPLVESAVQPFAAGGGNEMEDTASLKENAPATTLTLERAVSLDDFTYLAAGYSSVWQALAVQGIPGLGKDDKVEIIVVPADNSNLGDIAADLKKFLEQHALPGVEIVLSAYNPVVPDLDITLRVDSSAYDPKIIRENTQQALLTTFSLKKCKLGQSLFLSDLYKVVEAVTGVENSTCIIDNDPSLRLKKAQSKQDLVYIDPVSGKLNIITEEYYI